MSKINFNDIYNLDIKNNLHEWLYFGKNYKRWNDRLNPYGYTIMSNYYVRLVLTLNSISLTPDNIKQVFDYYFWSYIDKLLFGMIKKDVNVEILSDDKLSKYVNSYITEFIEEYDFLSYNGTTEHNRVLKSLSNYENYKSNNLIRMISSTVTNLEYEKIKITDSKSLDSDSLTSINEEYNEFTDILMNIINTKRWNGTFLNSNYNIAEHQLHVCFMLYSDYLLKYDSFSDSECTTLIGALLHDLGEYFTGDIISPLKKNIIGLDELLKDIELQGISKLISTTDSPVLNKLGIEFFKNEFNTNTDEYDGKLLKEYDIKSAKIEGRMFIQNQNYLNSLMNKL